MFQLLLFFRQVDPIWEQFYGHDSYEEYNAPDYSLDDNFPGLNYNVFVNEANFEDSYSFIRIDNGYANKILISKSFFSHSYSQELGGFIFVEYGSCIQYRVCSINSRVTKKGGHSYVHSDYMFENYIIESSISKSSGQFDTVSLEDGNQIISSTNISHCESTGSTAYGCYQNPSTLINFTSILNNIADNGCIMFHSTNYHNVYRCNIINNMYTKRLIEKLGIVVNKDCKRIEINSCVFSSNTDQNLFYNERGEFIVSQCYLRNNTIDQISFGAVSFSTRNKFVLNLHHLATQKCVADFHLDNIYRMTTLKLQPYIPHSKLIRKRI